MFLQILAQPPVGLFGLSAHHSFLPPSPRQLSANSSSRTTTPWTPHPPSPAPWSTQRSPPPNNSPPLQSAIVTSTFTLGNGSHEGANYHRCPPFPAAHAPSRPYKMAPTLRWSTSHPSPHLLPSSFEPAPKPLGAEASLPVCHLLAAV
jgi:hypothetical protein